MNQSPETFFRRTNKGPPVIVASGIKARSTRPKRGRRRRPSRKGRLSRLAPVKRTVSQKWRRKYNIRHLRDYARNYRPERNDEFNNQNLNVDEVSIESLNLNNEAVSGKKGLIGGLRRRQRRSRKTRRRRTRKRRGGEWEGPVMRPANGTWPARTLEKHKKYKIFFNDASVQKYIIMAVPGEWWGTTSRPQDAVLLTAGQYVGLKRGLDGLSPFQIDDVLQHQLFKQETTKQPSAVQREKTPPPRGGSRKTRRQKKRRRKKGGTKWCRCDELEKRATEICNQRKMPKSSADDYISMDEGFRRGMDLDEWLLRDEARKAPGDRGHLQRQHGNKNLLK